MAGRKRFYASMFYIARRRQVFSGAISTCTEASVAGVREQPFIGRIKRVLSSGGG